jgi:hypothetical protein
LLRHIPAHAHKVVRDGAFRTFVSCVNGQFKTPTAVYSVFLMFTDTDFIRFLGFGGASQHFVIRAIIMHRIELN